jgi:hypothetical protein
VLQNAAFGALLSKPAAITNKMENKKLLKRTEEKLPSSFNISFFNRDRRARI